MAAKRRAFGAGVTACGSAGAAVPDRRWSRSVATPLRPVRREAKTADHREFLTGIVVELVAIFWGIERDTLHGETPGS